MTPSLREEIEKAAEKFLTEHRNGWKLGASIMADFALSQVQAQRDRDAEIAQGWATSAFRRHKIESWTKHGLDVPAAICSDIAATIKEE